MFCCYFQSAYFFPCVVILHHLFVITSSFSGSTVHSRWLHWDRVRCWVLYCSHSGWWMLRSKLCLRFFLFPKRSILHMMVHTFASMYHLTGNYAILSITQTLFFHSQDLIYLIILHTNRQTVVNIWKSHILTAVKDVNMEVIFAVMNTLTAVQIYDFHIFITVYSPLHGFIWNQHIDQLPVGLLAQLVEHCTGIAEVMGSNPVQAWIFFRPSFHYYLSSVCYCEGCFHIHDSPYSLPYNSYDVILEI